MGRRRYASPSPAAAGQPPVLSVEGIEVTQAIQDPGHGVALVGGKATLVRVYLQSEVPVRVRGLLQVERPNQAMSTFVPSAGYVDVNPALNGNLATKRESTTDSLDFPLGPPWNGEGALVVQLGEVTTAAGTSASPVGGGGAVHVTFEPGVPLRVRLVGIRCGQPGATTEPSALDFSLLESWLRRAYPCAEVRATRLTVDSLAPWPFDCNQVNAQLLAMRAQDVAAGTDPRTHYYGLVSDAGGFMRGGASDIPEQPSPRAVASGPAGPDTWGWDSDGSYADWYAAHELSHTFGRKHPGFCSQTQDDLAYPYADGRISDASDEHVGYDMGDPALGIASRAHPWRSWHDVMTYCANQWISPYTYEALRQRLAAEDRQFAPAPASAGGPTPAAAQGGGRLLSVVSTANRTTGDGQFVSVLPVAAGTPDVEPGSAVRIVARAGAGMPHVEVGVPFTVNSCVEPGEEEVGTVEAIVWVADDVRRLELVVNGAVADVFEAPGAGGGPQPAGAGGGGVGARYTIQVSDDDGCSFQTVGLGLADPALAIDAGPYAERERVVVRVVESDGFAAQTRDYDVPVAGLGAFDAATATEI